MRALKCQLVIPAISGLSDAKNVPTLTILTLPAAQAIKTTIVPEGAALIIGSGIMGVEVGRNLQKAGM